MEEENGLEWSLKLKVGDLGSGRVETSEAGLNKVNSSLFEGEEHAASLVSIQSIADAGGGSRPFETFQS